MIENKAVGSNGDIYQSKHASQGKKLKKKNLFFWFFVEKLINICRVGRVNRVGQVTPIKHFFRPNLPVPGACVSI